MEKIVLLEKKVLHLKRLVLGFVAVSLLAVGGLGGVSVTHAQTTDHGSTVRVADNVRTMPSFAGTVLNAAAPTGVLAKVLDSVVVPHPNNWAILHTFSALLTKGTVEIRGNIWNETMVNGQLQRTPVVGQTVKVNCGVGATTTVTDNNGLYDVTITDYGCGGQTLASSYIDFQQEATLKIVQASGDGHATIDFIQ